MEIALIGLMSRFKKALMPTGGIALIGKNIRKFWREKMKEKLEKKLSKLYQAKDKLDDKIRKTKIELRRATLDEIWKEKVVRK